ncbi:D-alanine aminotransferase [hydrothermal vent metagenome]|uniref:D-alanine aminotransferase n=1 Tax=hydrothermal vent metagenome TaxID=652676 RepID=A0A3B0W4E5_9ZZZZ
MNNEKNIIYLNGQYKPVEEATVSVMDRGFLFGDGVYEIIPVFGNNMLRIDEHLSRLQNSLNRISLPNPHSTEQWLDIFSDLLKKNPVENSDNSRAVYLQVSRGVYPKRDLVIKPEYSPTIFSMVLQITPPDIERVSAGISVITIDDFRWGACDIKSTSLVANVMLKQQAVTAEVDDAILIKNNIISEGTASNVFLVKNDVLITPPTGHELLTGITRELVIEIAKNNTILVEEREIKEAELYNADEIWMTSSTREIAPVIRLNDKLVGSGSAGKMWKRIVDLYQQQK